MYYVYLYFAGRQLYERIAQCFDRAVDITLDYNIEFLEVAQCNTSAYFVECQMVRRTQLLFSFELVALSNYLTCSLFGFHNVEIIASLQFAFYTEYQYGFRRFSLFYRLVTFVEHCTYFTISIPCKNDISLSESAVLHQKSYFVSASFVFANIDNRTYSLAFRVCF